MIDKVLRLKAVSEATGKPPSGIYADMAAGRFPKPILTGTRTVGWLQSDIEDWIERRKSERDARARVVQRADGKFSISSEANASTTFSSRQAAETAALASINEAPARESDAISESD